MQHLSYGIFAGEDKLKVRRKSEVILRADIEGLGKIGSVVSVAPGISFHSRGLMTAELMEPT